jgi:hypothetical protein
MFLVSIAGPLVTVSGAVFADRLICQRLTDPIFLGPRHSTVGDLTPLDEGQRKVAQLIRALRKGLDVLKMFYQTLTPSRGHPSAPSQPQFQSYVDSQTGQRHDLSYIERLVPEYPEKTIFRAKSVHPGGTTAEVVVKFTRRYGMDGHIKLAEQSLAPALRFCQLVPAVGMIVVVMDYVSSDPTQQGNLQEMWKGGLKKGVELLHRHNLVFGDLRLPNLLMYKGAIMFIDFDWCGEDGVARYPGDICEDHNWHPDVGRNEIMKKAHDIYLLEQLQVSKRQALDEDSTRNTKLARLK